MDRAAKAVRRGGVKLLSLSGGHGDLNMIISELNDVKHSSKTFTKAQKSAAEYHMRWAAFEQNRAIQDTAMHMLELNSMWTEAQQEFTHQLKEYRSTFERILEGEKRVDLAKNKLCQCESKEGKIKKELKKCAKKATQDEIRVLENRLMQAEQARDLAQLELIEKIRENEVTKVIRYKAALLRLSEAYAELGKKCSIIFKTQMNVTQEIPDIETQELEDIKYTGAGTSRALVHEAKERLKRYRRQSTQMPTSPIGQPLVSPPTPERSDSLQCSFQDFDDLPPAYDLLENVPIQQTQQSFTSQTQSSSALEEVTADDLTGAMGGLNIRRETGV